MQVYLWSILHVFTLLLAAVLIANGLRGLFRQRALRLNLRDSGQSALVTVDGPQARRVGGISCAVGLFAAALAIYGLHQVSNYARSPVFVLKALPQVPESKLLYSIGNNPHMIEVAFAMNGKPETARARYKAALLAEDWQLSHETSLALNATKDGALLHFSFVLERDKAPASQQTKILVTYRRER